MGCYAPGRRVAAVEGTDRARAGVGRRFAWGRLSAFGLGIAVLTLVLDQGSKIWFVDFVGLADRGPIAMGRFVSLVLTWNTGISYGLFPQQGPVGQWLLFLFKVAAVLFLWIWLARASFRLTALSLGLIVGGAVGNAIDRLHWPGVMDFVLLHVESASFTFRWYVFNLADVAIVAGVIGLVYESLGRGSAVKLP